MVQDAVLLKEEHQWSVKGKWNQILSNFEEEDEKKVRHIMQKYNLKDN